MTPKELTLEAAQKIAEQSDYAFAASDTEHNPINWGDASAFVLEGYKACFAELTRWNDPKEALPEVDKMVLVKRKSDAPLPYDLAQYDGSCWIDSWCGLIIDIIGWRKIHQ